MHSELSFCEISAVNLVSGLWLVTSWSIVGVFLTLLKQWSNRDLQIHFVGYYILYKFLDKKHNSLKKTNSFNPFQDF